MSDEPTAGGADQPEQRRDTGGDAPAAGSIEEREAVAADDDELFEDAPGEGSDGRRGEHGRG